jgi:ABC-type multidrug transport system fused ATPase/permease subunit
MLFIVEPVGALVVVSFLGTSALLFYILIKNKVLGWGRSRLYHDGQITQHLVQGLNSVKDVKLMGREMYFLNKFDEHNSDKAKILSKQSTLLQVPRLYLEILAVIGLAGLVIMMLLQNRAMGTLIPTIGVFVAAAFRMIPSVNRIMNSIQSMRYSGPVVERLYQEFKLIKGLAKEEIDRPSVTRFLFKHHLDIRDLDFQYPETHRKAIDQVSLSFNTGETIGFIGASGSGKSTLIDIILGLLTPSSGNILVDGKDITSNMRGWQSQIGYVPQTIFLTDDTIIRNIAFGIKDEEIDKKSVLRALKAAQLDEYIDHLPAGLETNVGERGVKLSGGQRQRIGIARALYHDPQVLVLDEATSALDAVTELEVMKAVNALHGTKTILIVAHRLSTIQGCDKLFKLQNGKISWCGGGGGGGSIASVS